MKQIELVNAYKALSHLAVQTLPLKTAYAIHKLRRALAPAWEFHGEQEQALIQKHGGLIEGTTVRFGDPKDPDTLRRVNAYARDIAELNGLEAEFERPAEPVRVQLTDDIALTANEIDALDGIVEFYGGD